MQRFRNAPGNRFEQRAGSQHRTDLITKFAQDLFGVVGVPEQVAIGPWLAINILTEY
jgi:hypothetical protein